MKKINLFFLACCIGALSACGGTSDDEKDIATSEVPQAATAAFSAKYPTATDIKWVTETKKDHMIYEAKFTLDGKKLEAEFEPSGAFIMEE